MNKKLIPYTFICENCGKPFKTFNIRKKYCHIDCRKPKNKKKDKFTF